MEKYTIDIDKVLDEFEENEALKTDTIIDSKNEKIVKKYNNTPVTVEGFLKSSGNKELSLSCPNNEGSDYDNLRKIENNVLVQNKHLELPIPLSPTSYPKIESTCCEIASNDQYKTLPHIQIKHSDFSYDKDSKIFNYDIFYKQKDLEHFKEGNTSVNHTPSTFETTECGTNDNLEDEVLCVSVQEVISDKTLELEPNNSNVPELELENKTKSLTNSPPTKDVDVKRDTVHLDTKLEVDSACNNLKSVSNDNTSSILDVNCVRNIINEKSNKNLKDSSVIQSSYDSDEFISDAIQNSKKDDTALKFSNDSDPCLVLQKQSSSSFCNENCEKLSNNEKCLPCDITLESKEKNIFPDISCKKESLEDPQESSKISEEILKCNHNSVSYETKMNSNKIYSDNLIVNNNHFTTNSVNDSLKEDEVKKQDSPLNPSNTAVNYDESASCLETKEREENISNQDSSKDDNDTSFSEQWKMSMAGCVCDSRDSPNISQDDDSGVSSQEDISGNSPTELPNDHNLNSCSGNFDNVKETSSNCKLNHDYETFVAKPSVETNYNDYSSNEEKDKDRHVSVNTSGNLDHDSTSLKGTLNTEANKLSSNINCDVEQVNNNDKEDETKEFSESYNSKNTVSTVCDSVAIPSLCDKVSESVLSASVENENITETVINNSIQPSCSENDISSEEILNNNESEICSTLDCDMKNDELSHRLQRPTSLNLPPLQLSTKILDDDLNMLQCNPEDIQAVSSVTPIGEPASGVSYVKQQHQIGFVKPYWIPDSEASNCMHCAMKFTLIRRRHHCRACGKVLCSRCCNQRAHLAYMNKEDRICQPCAEILTSNSSTDLQNDHLPVSPDSLSSSSCGSSPNYSVPPPIPPSKPGDKTIWRPHPNNPDDYCSTIPPLQQMELLGQKPPPTVMVPIGVLKRGNKRRREPKQVVFSDGIRPGGDLTDLTEPNETVPIYKYTGRERMDKIISDDLKEGDFSTLKIQPKYQKRFLLSDGEGTLPPLFLHLGNEDKETVDWTFVYQRLCDEKQRAVQFILLKNLHIFVKVIDLDCCYEKECWCFTSSGFCSVGQDEVMVVLEKNPEEMTIPRDIFKFFTHVYDSACKGTTIDDLGHIIFPEKFLGSSDHRGFFFVRPSFQCLSKLIVPPAPYLVAILIHKWEVPWAKVFPLRLMLRLGAECRYYPCSLVSIRNRKPVFFEIGQTIMSVLADLRNYQFTLPVIPGLVVHMEEKKTCVNIPRNRYNKIMKVLKTNNVEHVISLGSNFCTEADSHLVCMQKEDGDYITQAINIENTVRKVTGASFIVFSGALKSSSGLSAKFSIVEDGLLIQIPQETIVALHVALREMRDLTIECGRIGASEPEEIVIVQWTRDDRKFNTGVRSPIDGKSFEGVSNLRIHTSTDYAGENYLIRWTEIFFIESEENVCSVSNEMADPCHMAETVAQSCCMALTPYLDQLAEEELTKIGLRITLDTERDKVGYEIGSCGKPFPSMYMNALDSGLIPIILRLSSSTQNEKLSFELIFHILIK